jgi:hypothetical protein
MAVRAPTAAEVNRRLEQLHDSGALEGLGVSGRIGLRAKVVLQLEKNNPAEASRIIDDTLHRSASKLAAAHEQLTAGTNLVNPHAPLFTSKPNTPRPQEQKPSRTRAPTDVTQKNPVNSDASKVLWQVVRKFMDSNIKYGQGQGLELFPKYWPRETSVTWRKGRRVETEEPIDCCGAGLQAAMNAWFDAMGVPRSKWFPLTENLGTDQPAHLREKFGCRVYGPKDLSIERLYALGPGTMLAGQWGGGKSHAEWVVQLPTGELVVASYGVQGQNLQFKNINEHYIREARSRNYHFANPLDKTA